MDTLILDIVGADRGFNVQADLVDQTADGINVNTLWDEYQESLNIWNAGRSALIAFLTFPVQELVEFIPTASGDDMEKASEFGVPQAIRGDVGGEYFGYAFDWFDAATRFTWKFLANAPANRVNAVHQAALEADNRLMFRMVFGALFYNQNRTNDEGNRVVSLYNGTDGTVPPEYRGKTFTSSHSHYLVSGAATIDSGDIEGLIDTIAEHGYGPAEGSQIIILANKQEVDRIRTWRANTANSNGSTALYDFIPASGQPSLLLPNTGLLGSLPPTSWNGLTVTGSYGNALIIEEAYIPAGYVVAFATGGAAALGNPVGLREHANPGLRGLRLINGERQGFPLINSYYQRGAGTGIRNRGAAAILQVKASGGYTAPSIYPVVA
uniref:Major capsid protein n=1 Tax=Micrococcus phage Kurnik TaxID=3092208 RepID=A0AAU6R5F6_9CAUD